MFETFQIQILISVRDGLLHEIRKLLNFLFREVL